jgi:hypothetical protein
MLIQLAIARRRPVQGGAQIVVFGFHSGQPCRRARPRRVHVGTLRKHSPRSMATINSVLGPLETADLGFTLTHEHIFTASAGILQTYPELFGDFERLADEAGPPAAA